MAEARSAKTFISLMDNDLAEGVFRSLLALHQDTASGLCFECQTATPCATVRIIASAQDAAVARRDPATDLKYRAERREVAGGRGRSDEYETRSQSEMLAQNANRRETHRFLYPECPQFSGGICNEHRDTPLAAAT